MALDLIVRNARLAGTDAPPVDVPLPTVIAERPVPCHVERVFRLGRGGRRA